MQVEEFLELSAERFPEKTALVCGGQRLTYRDMNERCNRLAHALVSLGLQRGDRVVIHLDNSVEAVLSLFAVLKAGAVFVMVNPTTKVEKLAYISHNCKARVLISHGRNPAGLDECRGQAPHLQHIVVAGTGSCSRETGTGPMLALGDLLSRHAGALLGLPKQCIDIDLAALIYTSGSTGNPKGVMMTHVNIVTAATAIITYLENTAEDVIFDVLPLSFDYGLYQVLMGFKVGATVVLERAFTYPHAVLETLIREKATGFPIVPTMSAILLQMNLARYDFSSLRYITNTAAALPTRHIEEMRKLFPRTKIYSMYGLTECKRVAYLPPDQLDRRPTSVGKAMPNEEVYIVDEQGARVGPGVVGELVVRGGNVMKGYWELPDETDKVLKAGPLPGEKVLYTGDLFRADAEGYLYFVGRKDDIIKSRGEKVSPKEVENALYNLDGIAEVAVIGIPDDILGQAIKAVITLREGVSLTDKDVLRHCAKHLEDYMVPKFVDIRDSLPQTLTGKIQKRALGIPAGGTP
jgi:amino acid adenylation domain-containing protein